MLNIHIKATGMELTPAIRAYAEEKITALKKLVSEDVVATADVEVGQTTHHHQSGKIFRCEINLSLDGSLMRAESMQEDLYAAIDVAKDELAGEVRKRKAKKEHMMRKGGRLFKSLLQKFGFGNED
jgi:ribosomal subunit interface protein